MEINNLHTVYFDGACGPNNPGGNIGLGFHLNYQGKEIHAYNKFIPRTDFEKHPTKRGYLTSNNLAEYLALEEALKYCLENKITALKVYGDSNLVIKQMIGEFGIKSGIYKKVALRCKRLLEQFDLIHFEFIYRDKNSRADELSKIGF